MTDFPAFSEMTAQHWIQAYQEAPPECDDLKKCIEKVCLEQGSSYNQGLEPDLYVTLKGAIYDLFRSNWSPAAAVNFNVRAMNYITAKNLSGDLCKGRQRVAMAMDLPREPVASAPADRGLRLPGRVANVMVMGGILVTLAWVIANDLHPAGSGDDAQIPILWSRLVETARAF